MKTLLYSVYDVKAKVFGTPFAMQTNGAAIRAFDDLVNDERSAVNKHPADYILYEIGSFDDEKAGLQQVIPIVQLGIGTDFVKSEKIDLKVK